ncbi:hypothetical protein Tco_0414509 [Tanacetum coccineum]
MEKDSEIYKGKKERIKSIALKAKKESSDDETSTSGSDDGEYAMAVRNFKKFFRRKGKFVKRPHWRELLEKEILELNEKIKKLKRSKEIEIACKSCEELKLENAKLKETQVKFVSFDKSVNSLREMLNNQKSPNCKIGLGFDSGKASTSGTKTMSFVGSSAEKAMDGSTIKVHRSTLPGSVCLRTCLEPDEWIKDSGCSKHMTGNKSLFSTYKAYDREHVDNLASNLLSVGQIYDNKCQVLFTEEGDGYPRKGQKSKPKRQNRAREWKEHKEKSKLTKSSQSQPREVDLERASKTEPENLNFQKWAHPYPPSGPEKAHLYLYKP